MDLDCDVAEWSPYFHFKNCRSRTTMTEFIVYDAPARHPGDGTTRYNISVYGGKKIASNLTYT